MADAPAADADADLPEFLRDLMGHDRVLDNPALSWSAPRPQVQPLPPRDASEPLPPAPPATPAPAKAARPSKPARARRPVQMEMPW